MNETVLQDALLALLHRLFDARDEIDGEDDDIALADIARDMVDEVDGLVHAGSFREAQLLTRDAGLVLQLDDGSEFQLSIVQSR